MGGWPVTIAASKMKVFMTTPDSVPLWFFKEQLHGMTGFCQSGVRVRVTACPAAFAHQPAADEVFVWAVDLARPPVEPDELFRRLTPNEQARALRYRVSRAREQFVIGRGLLRGLLADYLGMTPVAVPLDYLPSGKPVLSGGISPLHFNVTHTDGLLVLAAGRHRVGVDVERIRPLADADGLVERYFSPAEGAAFRALPEWHRPTAFFRGWTCKEAVIKAAGATVGCLADFDVELHPERPPRVNAVRDPQLVGPGWSLAEWLTPDRAAVALAVEGTATLHVETR
jgi:4'-phosphopantetheinyl transferase